MKLKQFALMALAVTVALCMFFARTVQTITTPKVQLLTAENGRFEEKLSFPAQVYFETTETIAHDDPHGMAVARTHVQPGMHVCAGDAVFTLHLPGYAEKRAALQAEHRALSIRLMELDAANHGLPREAPQRALYDTMTLANAALDDALYAARLEAAKAGAAVQETAETAAARAAYAEACEAYHAYHAAHPGSEAVLAYVNARDALLADMETLTAQLLALDLAAAQPSTVTAPHAGWIVAVDASTMSFTLTAEGCGPVLRCLAPGRTIAEGARADILTDLSGTVRSSVLEMKGSALHIALPETLLHALPALLETGAQVNITHRARQATTLLPVSALRGSGEDTYVYRIQYVYGGLLSTRSMAVVRTPVTVIERGSKTVSVAEDLEGEEIALREDRPLTDRQTVMNYIH